MATIRSIDFSMGVTTQELTRGLRRSRVAIDRWGTQVETRIHQVARATAASIGLFSAGITASVKSFVDFETALSRLATRTGLDLQTVVDSYANAIRDVAETTGEAGLEISEGIQRSISAGVGGTAARDLARQAARFQAAGLGSIVDGISAATTVTIAYKDATLDARDALDAITKSAQIGEGEVRDYANAFKRNAAVFETAGGSVEELGGALSAVAQVAPSVSEGATQLLRFITSGIIKPTERARKALARLNLPVERLRNIIGREGFVSGFSALKDVIGDDTQLLGEIFDSVEAIQFFENVTVEALQNLTGKVSEGIGTAVEDAYTIVEETTRNQLRRLGEVISFEAADIGGAFLNIIPVDLVARLRDFVAVAGNTIEAAITQVGNRIAGSSIFANLGAGFALINREVGIAIDVIENFGALFIEALADAYSAIEPLVQGITEIVNQFIPWEKVLRLTILSLTALVAIKIAAFFGAIAIGFIKAAAAAFIFVAQVAGILAIATVLSTAAVIIYRSFEEIGTLIIAVGRFIGEGTVNLFRAFILHIRIFFGEIVLVVKTALNNISRPINSLGEQFTNLGRVISEPIFVAFELFQELGIRLRGFFTNTVNIVTTALGSVLEAVGETVSRFTILYSALDQADLIPEVEIGESLDRVRKLVGDFFSDIDLQGESLFNVDTDLQNLADLRKELAAIDSQPLFDGVSLAFDGLSDKLKDEFTTALDFFKAFVDGDLEFTALTDRLKGLISLAETEQPAPPEEPRSERTPSPEEFEITLTHILGQEIVAGIGSSIRDALKRRDFSQLGDDIINAFNDVLVTDVTNSFQRMFRRFGQRMQEFALQSTNENDGFILRMTRTLTEGFRNFFSTIGDALESGLQLLLGSQTFQRLASAIGGLFNSAFGGLGGVFAGFFGGIFHQGGIVPGSPGQDVPIIAEAGEYVLTPDQVDQLSIGNRPIVLQMSNTNVGNIERQALEAIQYNAESVAQALGPALNLQYGGRGVV